MYPSHLGVKVPLLVINELNKATREFQRMLVDDTIPERIETRLGEEIYYRLRGETQWTSNAHKLDEWLRELRKSLVDHPEKMTLPNAFHRSSFDVALAVGRYPFSCKVSPNF